MKRTYRLFAFLLAALLLLSVAPLSFAAGETSGQCGDNVVWQFDEATGTLITSLAILAAKGVDYLFDVRYPQARQSEELVAAGTAGAIDGFLAAFKPVDCPDCGDDTVKTAKAAAAPQAYDKEAYEFFKKAK